jgi:transposase
VISGIIYVIRNGLQWKDAPMEYGPHKTLYNRFNSQVNTSITEVNANLTAELAKINNAIHAINHDYENLKK